jgi:hypothetical protein
MDDYCKQDDSEVTYEFCQWYPQTLTYLFESVRRVIKYVVYYKIVHLDKGSTYFPNSHVLFIMRYEFFFSGERILLHVQLQFTCRSTYWSLGQRLFPWAFNGHR